MTRYFNTDGLRAIVVADAVAAVGPLRYAPLDGRFWVYEAGVWTPGDRVVHRRIVRILRDRYRPNHAATVRDVLRSELEELHVRPVPDFINFRNEMVDWAAAGLPGSVAHDPAHQSTAQLAVDWDPGSSSCDKFDEFLDQSVAADDRVRVWEILGYLMMSGNPLQRMFLFTGAGGNGKGVLMAVIKAILGHANVSSVALNEFTDDTFASADLYGRMANICGDIDTTFIEKTGLIKKLSGEDEIRAQRKYGQPFGYEWFGKALFSANAIPTAADTSHGWLRRWEIVNFPNRPAHSDPTLKDRLCEPESLRAIAVRAVLALRELMSRGEFGRGDSATAAHLEFAMRNNKLLAWIDDDAYFDASSWYPREVLLRAFRNWDHGQNPGARGISAATFYERLRQIAGMRDAKIKGTRGFRGIRLNCDARIVDLTPDSEAPPEGGAGTDFAEQTMF